MRISDRTILVVEDDEPKRASLERFLRDRVVAESQITFVGSLNSAIAHLSEHVVDLCIVDMSIPTFDISSDRRGGGQPQGFGGADILRFLDSESTTTRSVVLTQYEEFPPGQDGVVRSAAELESHLRRELDERFLGVIYYAGQHDQWQEALAAVIERIGLAKML